MAVVQMPPDSLDRIRDAGLRAAAARFEAETGQRLAAMFKLPADEGVLGIYLIMRGYSPFDRTGPSLADAAGRD